MKGNKYDYSLLEGLIVSKFGSRQRLAKEVGMSPITLSRKLNNQRNFTQDEIYAIAFLLGITDYVSYFFKKEG